MSGHTKGPWRHLGHGTIGTLHGEEVADMLGRPASDVFKANLALVTAAPDLLEALEGAVEWMACVESHLRDGQPFQRNLAEYRAAIAKARGQA